MAFPGDSQPWPLGDVVPKQSLSQGIDAARPTAVVDQAFSDPAGGTSASLQAKEEIYGSQSRLHHHKRNRRWLSSVTTSVVFETLCERCSHRELLLPGACKGLLLRPTKAIFEMLLLEVRVRKNTQNLVPGLVFSVPSVGRLI